MMRRVRTDAGVFVFVISVALLVWGFKPLEHMKRSQPISPSQLQPPTIPEQRKLTLEYPIQIRAGDLDIVRLMLGMGNLPNVTPAVQFNGNAVSGEGIEIPNIYESHNVIAEAKFDIAGIQVSPPGPVSQILSQGQTVTFSWIVHPERVGVYNGTIWFYLRFVDKVSGEESRETVSAQIVEIEAVNFLGVPASVVRTAGGVGLMVGVVTGFPFFKDVVRFIGGRRVINKNMTKIT